MFRRIILSIVLFFLAASPSFAGDALWKSYFKGGQHALETQNYKESTQLFKTALAEATGDGNQFQQSQSLFALAQSCIGSKDYPEAIARLTECVNMNEVLFQKPSAVTSTSLESLAETFELAGNTAEAEGSYKKALKLMPTGCKQESRVLSKLARLYTKRGKTIEAKALTESAGAGVETIPASIGEYVAAFQTSSPNYGRIPNPFAAPSERPDWETYMADMQRTIKRAWFPPINSTAKRASVVFKVHRDGQMSNLRLDKSSGLAVFDQAALKSVENAAPFRPLPPGAKDDVDIQFTFTKESVFAGGAPGVFRQF